MSDSARIHDVEALKVARGALADFAEQVGTSLASVDADIERVAQWLNVDRATHWKMEVRRRTQEMEKGKSDIMRKRIIAAPEPASVVFEERQVDRARRRLEVAQAKLDKVHRWMPVWQREAMMYKGSTRALTEALHADIPRAMGMLAAMMESLEGYAAILPPAGEPEPSGDFAAEAMGQAEAAAATPPPPPTPPLPPDTDAGGKPGEDPGEKPSP